MAKERADVLCVNQGLFESREKAKRAIMAGIVFNDNIRIDKAGEKVEESKIIKSTVIASEDMYSPKNERILFQFVR